MSHDKLDLTRQENKLNRLSAYRQLQAMSHQINLCTRGRFADLDAFSVPDRINVSPVKSGEERFVRRVGINKQQAGFLQADGTETLLLPSEPNWWVSVPLLVTQLDQGSIGSAGCAFATHSLEKLVQNRWDIFHRSVRDVRLALQHTANAVLLQAQMHSTYLWGLAYRPFGTGAFMEQKRRMLQVMMMRETPDTCIPFRGLWEQIKDDLDMGDSATAQDVWQALPDLDGFHCKQTLPKVSRWFSWNQSAEEQLPFFHALKLVLAYEFASSEALDSEESQVAGNLDRLCSDAASSSAEKINMRDEFSKIKKQLGGGFRLAHALSSERLFRRCQIIALCTRPTWTWYANMVKHVTSPLHGVRRAIEMADIGWRSDAHLRETTAVLCTASDPLLQKVLSSDLTEAPSLVMEFTLQVLKHRAWSLSRHDAPPDSYAAILGDCARSKAAAGL